MNFNFGVGLQINGDCCVMDDDEDSYVMRIHFATTMTDEQKLAVGMAALDEWIEQQPGLQKGGV